MIEESQSQQWEVTQSVCGTPGAEDVTVYGVRVRCTDGITWEWPDVDVDQTAAARLAARLQVIQPARCHWVEMVLDFIEERADPFSV